MASETHPHHPPLPKGEDLAPPPPKVIPIPIPRTVSAHSPSHLVAPAVEGICVIGTTSSMKVSGSSLDAEGVKQEQQQPVGGQCAPVLVEGSNSPPSEVGGQFLVPHYIPATPPDNLEEKRRQMLFRRQQQSTFLGGLDVVEGATHSPAPAFEFKHKALTSSFEDENTRVAHNALTTRAGDNNGEPLANDSFHTLHDRKHKEGRKREKRRHKKPADSQPQTSAVDNPTHEKEKKKKKRLVLGVDGELRKETAEERVTRKRQEKERRRQKRTQKSSAAASDGVSPSHPAETNIVLKPAPSADDLDFSPPPSPHIPRLQHTFNRDDEEEEFVLDASTPPQQELQPPPSPNGVPTTSDTPSPTTKQQQRENGMQNTGEISEEIRALTTRSNTSTSNRPNVSLSQDAQPNLSHERAAENTSLNGTPRSKALSASHSKPQPHTPQANRSAPTSTTAPRPPSVNTQRKGFPGVVLRPTAATPSRNGSLVINPSTLKKATGVPPSALPVRSTPSRQAVAKAPTKRPAKAPVSHTSPSPNASVPPQPQSDWSLSISDDDTLPDNASQQPPPNSETKGLRLTNDTNQNTNMLVADANFATLSSSPIEGTEGHLRVKGRSSPRSANSTSPPQSNVFGMPGLATFHPKERESPVPVSGVNSESDHHRASPQDEHSAIAAAHAAQQLPRPSNPPQRGAHATTRIWTPPGVGTESGSPPAASATASTSAPTAIASDLYGYFSGGVVPSEQPSEPLRGTSLHFSRSPNAGPQTSLATPQQSPAPASQPFYSPEGPSQKKADVPVGLTPRHAQNSLAQSYSGIPTASGGGAAKTNSLTSSVAGIKELYRVTKEGRPCTRQKHPKMSLDLFGFSNGESATQRIHSAIKRASEKSSHGGTNSLPTSALQRHSIQPVPSPSSSTSLNPQSLNARLAASTQYHGGLFPTEGVGIVLSARGAHNGTHTHQSSQEVAEPQGRKRKASAPHSALFAGLGAGQRSVLGMAPPGSKPIKVEGGNGTRRSSLAPSTVATQGVNFDCLFFKEEDELIPTSEHFPTKEMAAAAQRAESHLKTTVFSSKEMPSNPQEHLAFVPAESPTALTGNTNPKSSRYVPENPTHHSSTSPVGFVSGKETATSTGKKQIMMGASGLKSEQRFSPIANGTIPEPETPWDDQGINLPNGNTLSISAVGSNATIESEWWFGETLVSGGGVVPVSSGNVAGGGACWEALPTTDGKPKIIGGAVAQRKNRAKNVAPGTSRKPVLDQKNGGEPSNNANSEMSAFQDPKRQRYAKVRSKLDVEGSNRNSPFGANSLNSSISVEVVNGSCDELELSCSVSSGTNPQTRACDTSDDDEQAKLYEMLVESRRLKVQHR